MIQKVLKLLFVFCLFAFQNAEAQTTVTGVVTDGNSGIPLAGANVIVKGTSNGVSTNFDGEYSIDVSGSATLVFSYIGYTEQEIVVNNQSTINVALAEDASELDEVVVTALGIRREAKALGYSVAKVDTERILASGTPVNALQSLYGTAAGVTVGQTAVGPSGGMKINIRNAVSFDALSTTRPLIVVDGVPIFDENSNISFNARSGRDNGTGINDINPDDIASIEILKGAKASVLYGSEGANGVMLITTKSGSKSKGLGVSFSLTTTMEKAAFYPDFQDTFGTGRSASTSVTDDQGYFLDENNERALDPSGGAFGPRFDPSVTLNWWDGSQRPWQAAGRSVYEQLFRTGSQQVANVSLSGGSDKGSVRFSYTNTDYDPINLNANFQKHAFSFSSAYDLNDWISVKYSGNYFTTDNTNASYAGSFSGQGGRASLGAYGADINVGLLKDRLVTENGYNYFAGPDVQRRFISDGRSSVVNTLWDWTQNESLFKRVHSIQSLTLDLKFTENLGLTILGGLDNTVERNEYKGKLQDPSLIGPTSGSVYRDVSRVIRLGYGQATLNYEKDINENLNISGFVGGVVRHNYSETKGAEQIGNFVIPNFFSFSNLPSGVRPSYNNDNGEDALYSLLGSVQFDWKGQVYIEAQARQDWSSILPPDNNSYFYPGLSATWIASNSLQLPDVVKFLKVRTSWADVGRPGPRYFSNVNLGVSQSGSGFIISPPSSLPPIDGNFIPNLKPERKREFEVGLEGYFFENRRLGLDLSIYHANTYDQIMAVTAPPGLGVSSLRINAGDVANTGWELALKTKPIFSKDFQWNLDIAISGSKTKVNELDGEISSLSLWGANGINAVAKVGGEYGVLLQNQGFQNYINPSDDNDPNNGKRVVANGGQRYNYSADSNRKVGKLLPDVFGGVFSRLNYKNFGLVFNMDYQFGATVLNTSESYMMAAGTLSETLQYRDAASGGVAYYVDGTGQKVAGTNPSGPTFNDGVILDGVRLNGTQNTQVVAADDYYYQSYFSNGFYPEDRIFKSDYIALRNIALDYRLPDVSKTIGLSDVVVSVFANNVAYIYRAAPNTVPESTNGTGWNSASYGTTALPLQRSFGVSFKAKI